MVVPDRAEIDGEQLMVQKLVSNKGPTRLVRLVQCGIEMQAS